MFYDQRVPAPQVQAAKLPRITKGISDSGWTPSAEEGFAEELVNCSYRGDQLLLGRGSADQVAINSSYIVRKMVYSDSDGLYYGITESSLFSLDLSTGTFTTLDTSSGSIGFTDIKLFNQYIVAAKDGELLYYDGTDVYHAGSSLAWIIRPFDPYFLYYSDDVFDTQSAVSSGTFSGNHRITSISVVMRKDYYHTGLQFGEDFYFILKNTTTGDEVNTLPINPDVGVTVGRAIIDISLVEPLLFSDGDGWQLDIVPPSTADSHDRTLCIVHDIRPYPDQPQIDFNGYITPKATHIAIANGQLHCFADQRVSAPAEGYPIYFSAYNDPSDFYSTSSDGMISYGGFFYLDNDIHSVPTAMESFQNYLAVAGYAGNGGLTELRDENHFLATATTDVVPYPECLISASSMLVFLQPRSESSQFALHIWGGEGEAGAQPNYAQFVSAKVGEQWSAGARIRAMLDNTHDTLWVCHGDQTDIWVFYLKTKQWVTFRFNFTVSGMDYINGKVFIYGQNGGIYEYSEGGIDTNASPIVKTKKFRPSPFTRAKMREFIWFIENSNFSGKVTITGELEQSPQSYTIAGNPPKPVRVHGLNDIGFVFELSDVTISELTPVGEIVCRAGEDGRALNE